jgi:hypothetical protein
MEMSVQLLYHRAEQTDRRRTFVGWVIAAGDRHLPDHLSGDNPTLARLCWVNAQPIGRNATLCAGHPRNPDTPAPLRAAMLTTVLFGVSFGAFFAFLPLLLDRPDRAQVLAPSLLVTAVGLTGFAFAENMPLLLTNPPRMASRPCALFPVGALMEWTMPCAPSGRRSRTQ